MSDKNKQHYTGDEEIIQKNVERSQEVIEARKHQHDDDSRVPPDAEMTAPKDHREEVWDVPVGGQQNPNFGGGTAKRHKAG